MPSKKRATPISLQPLDALFGTNEETNNGICEIKIGSLHPFPNHPFQVKDDKKMEELSESITQYGVLVPGIVRLREYFLSRNWMLGIWMQCLFMKQQLAKSPVSS